MGSLLDYALDTAMERYENQKSEWIRKRLNNPDADESTHGWNELEEEYNVYTAPS